MAGTAGPVVVGADTVSCQSELKKETKCYLSLLVGAEVCILCYAHVCICLYMTEVSPLCSILGASLDGLPGSGLEGTLYAINLSSLLLYLFICMYVCMYLCMYECWFL